MANSVTNLDLISSGQAQKELTANNLFDAGSKSMLYGRRGSTTTGLTWGFYGGNLYGVATPIPNGTVALIPNATNYVEANQVTGVVTTNTSGFFDATHYPLYIVVAGATTVTSYTDKRPEAFGIPVATDAQFGVGKPDGTTIVVNNGIYSLAAGALSFATKYNGSTLTGNTSSFNFTGPGVVVTNVNGDVTVTISGSGSSSLEYYNDVRALKAYWRPGYGSNGLTLGPWSGTSSAGYTYTESLYTKYGKILAYNTVGLQTTAVANNFAYVCASNTSGNQFRRDGFLRSITHMLFGVGVSSLSSGEPTTNSTFLAGITNSPSSNSGNNLGTTNDFNIVSATFGVGWRPTDTNLQIVFVSPSNVKTVIDLGNNFPIPNEPIGIKSFYEVIYDDMGTRDNIKITVKRLDELFTTSTIVNHYPPNYGNSYPAAFYQLRTTDAVAKKMSVSNIEVFQTPL